MKIKSPVNGQDITAGKKYKVEKFIHPDGAYIEDDVGCKIFCFLPCSGHIGGNSWGIVPSVFKKMKSHIKECFGFVPVREFGEFLRSDKMDILAIAIIAGLFAGYFFYLLVKVL